MGRISAPWCRLATGTFLKRRRLSFEVTSLRSGSPAKLQLPALWGEIPPARSGGGWISVNLQGLSAVQTSAAAACDKAGLPETDCVA